MNDTPIRSTKREGNMLTRAWKPLLVLSLAATGVGLLCTGLAPVAIGALTLSVPVFSFALWLTSFLILYVLWHVRDWRADKVADKELEEEMALHAQPRKLVQAEEVTIPTMVPEPSQPRITPQAGSTPSFIPLPTA